MRSLPPGPYVGSRLHLLATAPGCGEARNASPSKWCTENPPGPSPQRERWRSGLYASRAVATFHRPALDGNMSQPQDRRTFLEQVGVASAAIIGAAIAGLGGSEAA